MNLKTLMLLISIFFIIQSELIAQITFVLEPTQSMIMTGKGPGQDGTINPYFGKDCYAIIKNIGKRTFSIRIQEDGKIVEEIPILKGDIKKVKLLKDYELYLDSNPKGIAKASVFYEKLDK